MYAVHITQMITDVVAGIAAKGAKDMPASSKLQHWRRWMTLHHQKRGYEHTLAQLLVYTCTMWGVRITSNPSLSLYTEAPHFLYISDDFACVGLSRVVVCCFPCKGVRSPKRRRRRKRERPLPFSLSHPVTTTTSLLHRRRKGIRIGGRHYFVRIRACARWKSQRIRPGPRPDNMQ